ncbi:MAG: hypothetical protein KC733_01330, partial [Candidatus Omnitrophica bacterium]|nr:hypothetical protein [Candidatus Omnitrophota bacterium]
IGHSVALQFIDNIRSPESSILTKWITPEMEELAISIFAAQKSKNVSFTDCTNMALMSFFKVDAIFSFDYVYKTNGFEMLDTFYKKI